MRVDSWEQMNNPSLTFFFGGGKNREKIGFCVIHHTSYKLCLADDDDSVDQTDEKLSAALIWLTYNFC